MRCMFTTQNWAKNLPVRIVMQCSMTGVNLSYMLWSIQVSTIRRISQRIIIQSSPDIKPYVCEQCGKGFNWVASFQDHMDMHSGVKKYTCEFCNRQFTKRNTLNNHRQYQYQTKNIYLTSIARLKTELLRFLRRGGGHSTFLFGTYGHQMFKLGWRYHTKF